MKDMDWLKENISLDQGNLLLELKSSIEMSIEEKYKEEMDRLRYENEKLQDVKENYENIKEEHASALKGLEVLTEGVRDEVRRERLSSLMKGFELIMYKAVSVYSNSPKCDRCDEDRRIHFVSPSGRKLWEFCECDAKIFRYEPKEFSCYEFKVNAGNTKMLLWYKANTPKDRDDYASIYSYGESAKTLYDPDDDQSDVNPRDLHFKTEGECQAYCDWLNECKKEKKKTVNSKGVVK